METALAALILLGVLLAALFGSAGRWDLPLFWAVLVVNVLYLTLGMLAIDPALRRERLRPAPGGTDRHIAWLVRPLYLAHWVLAGLDVGRFGWSAIPLWVRVVGLVGLVCSWSLVLWAVRTNRFFSPVVRIWQERDHSLIAGGPYRYVRHPGYLGVMGGFICSAFALGSFWALLPALLIVGVFLRRTILEDRFLRANLESYSSYVAAVRYRLVPGLW